MKSPQLPLSVSKLSLSWERRTLAALRFEFAVHCDSSAKRESHSAESSDSGTDVVSSSIANGDAKYTYSVFSLTGNLLLMFCSRVERGREEGMQDEKDDKNTSYGAID